MKFNKDFYIQKIKNEIAYLRRLGIYIDLTDILNDLDNLRQSLRLNDRQKEDMIIDEIKKQIINESMVTNTWVQSDSDHFQTSETLAENFNQTPPINNENKENLDLTINLNIEGNVFSDFKNLSKIKEQKNNDQLLQDEDFYKKLREDLDFATKNDNLIRTKEDYGFHFFNKIAEWVKEEEELYKNRKK